MKELQERILKEGKVLDGNVLKVDGFLNHRMDPALMHRIGEEFAKAFQYENIDCILTIESSGIAPALCTGLAMGVPVIFAKKGKSANTDKDVYVSTVHSYTKNKDYEVTVSREYLLTVNRVLLIDDFLANGEAMNGLLNICKQAGVTVTGIGIVIEKGFQPGGRKLREAGYKVISLAKIGSMDHGIVFEESV